MKATKSMALISSAIILSLCSILTYDYWNNTNHYYLYSSDQADSRLEVYQGKPGSPDFFQKHKFLMEPPFLHKQLEPGSCIQDCEISDPQELVNSNIRYLPLLQKISSYIDDGQFNKAFSLIDKTLQSNNHENALKTIKLLGKIRINKVLPRLINKMQNDPSSTMRTAVRESMPIVATRILFKAKSFDDWERLKDRNVINYLSLHTDWVQSNEDFYLLYDLAWQYMPDEDTFFKGSDLAFQTLIATSGDGNIKTKEFLRVALEDKDTDIKRAATLALGLIRDASSLPRLIKQLSDKNPNVKRNAVRALTALSSNLDIKPLITKTINEKITANNFHSEHVEVLSKIVSPIPSQSLAKLLNHEDIAIRLHATEGIYKLAKTGMHSNKNIPLLIERLTDSFDEIQANASYALAELKADKAIKPLINNLSSQNEYARFAAACSLGRLKAKQAIPILLKSLYDKEPELRRCSANAIKEMHSDKATQTIIDALSNNDASIRSMAATALGIINPPKAVPQLILKLSDNNERVRQNAAEALGELKASKALKPLIALLKSENATTRGLAARALGKIGIDDAIRPLIQLLNDKDNFTVSHAITALGTLKAGQAVKPIESFIDSEDMYVQRAAIVALGELKANESIQLLIKKADEESDIADALGKLEAKEATSTLLQVFNTVNDINAEAKRYFAAKSLGNIGSLKALEPLLLHIYDHNENFEVNKQSYQALVKIAQKYKYQWLEKWLKQFEPSSRVEPEVKNKHEKKIDTIKQLPQQQLLALIKNEEASRSERIIALEVCVRDKPELAKKALLELLNNEKNEAIFVHQLFQFIGELEISEALPIIQQRLFKREKEWQRWRIKRDNLPNKPSKKQMENLLAMKPKPVISAYSYAEAIARISPTDGIKLLQNSLFEARRGAWEGLARLADVALLKKLNKLRENNKKNPVFRHALYRAIDLSLLHIDANASKQDCIALNEYLNTLKKSQPDTKIIDPVILRIEWTRDRIDETLESIIRSKWRIQNWSKSLSQSKKYHYRHCYN